MVVLLTAWVVQLEGKGVMMSEMEDERWCGSGKDDVVCFEVVIGRMQGGSSACGELYERLVVKLMLSEVVEAC